MRITIKSATGWTENVEVSEMDTSDVLRQKVAQVMNDSVSPSQVRLVFHERPIGPGILKNNGIKDGDELALVISEEQLIEITVLYEKKRIKLTVDAFEFVKNLKATLSDEVGLSVDEQRLLFRNTIMEDGRLNHYEVGHGDQLQLIMRGIQIFVLDVKGKTHIFDVQTSDNVERLQRLVQQKTGVSPNQFRLEYGGIQLEAGNMLKYYNIQAESTVHMSIRLRGGGIHLWVDFV